MSYTRTETVEENITQFVARIVHSSNANLADNDDNYTTESNNKEHEKCETVTETGIKSPDALDIDISTKADATDELNFVDSANVANEEQKKSESVTERGPGTPDVLDIDKLAIADATDKLNVVESANAANEEQMKSETVTKRGSESQDALDIDIADASQTKAELTNPYPPDNTQSISDITCSVQLQSQLSLLETDGEPFHVNDPENGSLYVDASPSSTYQILLDEIPRQSRLQSWNSSDGHYLSHQQHTPLPYHRSILSDYTRQEATSQERKQRKEGARATSNNYQIRPDIPTQRSGAKKDFVILSADDDDDDVVKFKNHILRDFPPIQPPLTVDIFNRIDAGKSVFQSLESLPGRYRFILLYATNSFRRDRNIQFFSEIIVTYGQNTPNEQFIPVMSKEKLDIDQFVTQVKGLDYWRYTQNDLKQIYIEQVNNLLSRLA